MHFRNARFSLDAYLAIQIVSPMELSSYHRHVIVFPINAFPHSVSIPNSLNSLNSLNSVNSLES